MSSDRARFRPALVLEFSGLALLIFSLFLLGQFSDRTETGFTATLLLAALSSLATFIGFVWYLFLRWSASSAGQLTLIHRLLFAMLVLSLSSLWIGAVVQTWRSISAS